MIFPLILFKLLGDYASLMIIKKKLKQEQQNKQYN